LQKYFILSKSTNLFRHSTSWISNKQFKHSSAYEQGKNIELVSVDLKSCPKNYGKCSGRPTTTLQWTAESQLCGKICPWNATDPVAALKLPAKCHKPRGRFRPVALRDRCNVHMSAECGISVKSNPRHFTPVGRWFVAWKIFTRRTV
jgi:hypothetical protein